MSDRKPEIMQAALGVVTRYGYRRSSMDDIAKAAGISRPALYQYFRNKEDVFLSCVDMVIENGFAGAEAAAAKASSEKEKVAAFLGAYMGFYYGIVVAGPHGAEIQTVNNELGLEKTDHARVRLIARLNELAGLSADDENGVVLAHASEGLKMRAPDKETLARRIKTLVSQLL